MSASIKDNGDVSVDGAVIGQLDGLKFTPAKNEQEENLQLTDANAAFISAEINRRMTSICSGTHQIFTLSDQGEIRWGDKVIGRIAPSGSVFSPDAELIGGDLGKPALQQMTTDRMREYLRAEVTTLLAPLASLKTLSEGKAAQETAASAPILPAAQDFAAILLGHNGAVERSDHLQAIRNLDQDARRQLRSAGVTFGYYNIYLSDLTKPKPTRLLSLLIAHGAGGHKKPFIPFAGVTSVANEGDLASENYPEQALSLAGYRAVGPRIIRFDILNRLSFMIREAQEIFTQTQKTDPKKSGGHKFQIMDEMLALLGTSYADMQAVLRALGYSAETLEPAPKKPQSDDSASAATPPQDTAQNSPAQNSPAQNSSAQNSPVQKTKKPLTLHHPREVDAEGKTIERENLEYWVLPRQPRKTSARKTSTKQHPSSKKAGKATKYKSAGHKSAGHKSADHKSGAPTARQIENSPFAALQALKTPKKDP